MNGFAAQGGNTAADEVAIQKVAELIREVQADRGMVTKFVLIVETVEEDDRYLSSFTSPGLKEWESIGLLEWAKQQEGRCALEEDDE